jgi:hypothetical protein
MNKLRNWLERNRIFFEVFFFSLVPIIIGVFSYINSNEQLKISKAEHLPVFKFNEYVDYDSINGHRLTHYIALSNVGYHVQRCQFVPMAFLNVTLSEMNTKPPRGEYHILIPLKAYFGIGYQTNDSKGYLGDYVTTNNAKTLEQLSNELDKCNHVISGYFISWPLAIITKINYEDYNGNIITEYYLENQDNSHYKVDYKLVEKYVNSYDRYEGNFSDVSSVFIIQQVQEYIKQNLR